MKRIAASLLSLFVLAGCSSPSGGFFGFGSRGNPTAQPLPPSAPGIHTPDVLTLQMTDASRGWAVTRDGVLRTEDGGSTWTQVTSKGAVFDLPGPVFFLDERTAWVTTAEVPSRLLHTTDGGKTWRDVPSRDLRFLTFADAANGWGMTRDNGATGGQELVTVYRTSDGGKTWTMVAHAGIPGTGLNNFPLAGMKNGLAFRDTQAGWAAGYLTNVEGPWLYATTDGGRTWREQTLSLPKALQDRFVVTNPPILFAGDKAILPVWSIHADDDRPAAVFLRSSDGGQTWQAGKVVRNESTWNPAFFFLNPNVGWLTDGKKLYTTSDGGETWQTRTPNVTLGNVRSLDFVSPETGWAVIGGDQPQVLKTTDGGATWSPVSISQR